ncbi:MAG TPA: 50S ribosomal protein L30 [Acidobacteriota bacterium]|nr:50S ribosomal protein L30 [Acidobacteriota bacterium]
MATKEKKAPKTLKITYYRSAIGRSYRQKAIVKGLGFTKLNQVVERPDTPEIRGMVAKISHLVKIVEEQA